MKYVKESSEELQNVLKQGEGQTVAVSTQTEVKRECRGIQASDHVETETTMPETQNQGTQAEFDNPLQEQLRQKI
ncbi:hypothetical protein GOM44_05590 [Wolbachia endosymbiont of Atemnus politus]|uniref:hypothetical protein n=1 Tax=Wolbachia endosymbiont of Atemnus politus TaxID=2682840 RepID=UPI001571E0E1|nr:hypothetical protein [Wolbachia endosymbiont of Atemnus politus]NSX83720.1 hypothetical protein [Wolbachia endosymbiont of Atemnus politus]